MNRNPASKTTRVEPVELRRPPSRPWRMAWVLAVLLSAVPARLAADDAPLFDVSRRIASNERIMEHVRWVEREIATLWDETGRDLASRGDLLVIGVENGNPRPLGVVPCDADPDLRKPRYVCVSTEPFLERVWRGWLSLPGPATGRVELRQRFRGIASTGFHAEGGPDRTEATVHVRRRARRTCGSGAVGTPLNGDCIGTLVHELTHAVSLEPLVGHRMNLLDTPRVDYVDVLPFTPSYVNQVTACRAAEPGRACADAQAVAVTRTVHAREATPALPARP